METSNFRTAQFDPNAVAICVHPPRDWKGKCYLPLAPRYSMLNLPPEEFIPKYEEILSKLDPEKVLADLGEEAVLLCWEAVGDFCHRRLAAKWLESTLGIPVPERTLEIPEAETVEEITEESNIYGVF